MPSRRDFLKGALAAASVMAAAGLFEYIYIQKHVAPSSVPSSSTQTEQVTTAQLVNDAFAIQVKPQVRPVSSVQVLTNDAFAIGTRPVLVSTVKLTNDAFAIQVKPTSHVQLLTNDAFAIMQNAMAA